jgi:hypothetical protein
VSGFFFVRKKEYFLNRLLFRFSYGIIKKETMPKGKKIGDSDGNFKV